MGTEATEEIFKDSFRDFYRLQFIDFVSYLIKQLTDEMQVSIRTVELMI